MCFSLHMAILMEVSNKGIQLWHILLKMCVCGVKNIIFKLKLLQIFKIQTNYKYFSCEYFTFHVSIYLSLQTSMWINHLHSGGVIPMMLVHDDTMVDDQVLSHQQWHIFTWHVKYLYEKYLLLVYIINICKTFHWIHCIFDSI